MLLEWLMEAKNVNAEPRKKIFISYAMQDRKILPLVVEKLQQVAQDKQELHIVDPKRKISMGEDFRQLIHQSIQESDEVVVVWTAASAASTAVNYEAGMAEALGKPLVIVVADRSAPELPWFLQAFRSLKLAEDY